ncbi:MAG TPA: hypothetical protein VER03_26595 [Bryobacteraceae bacterium]|nr:hypothetical protein [Bryobacteraceae bacterium]
MNHQTIAELPEAAIEPAATTPDEKKDWTTPTLERFDIGSATQNAGWLAEQDGDHAAAQS